MRETRSLAREDPLGEGNGYPFQYSCLGNSMDREAWQVHGLDLPRQLDMTEQLTHTHTHTHTACLTANPLLINPYLFLVPKLISIYMKTNSIKMDSVNFFPVRH